MEHDLNQLNYQAGYVVSRSFLLLFRQQKMKENKTS